MQETQRLMAEPVPGISASPDEANALYPQAEAKLGEDFPTAPLDYKTATFGWSSRRLPSKSARLPSA